MRINFGWLLVVLLVVISVGFSAIYFELRQENIELKRFLSVSKEVVVAPLDVPGVSPIVSIPVTSFRSKVALRIMKDEGVRTSVYDDGKGNWTIGVGRNLSGNGISIAELKAIVGELDYDLLLRETHIENGRVRIKSLALAKRIFVKPLTEDDIHLLLLDDLKTTENDAVSVFGRELWGQIGVPRQEALIDTIFVLGLPHFEQFVNLISAVKAGNWNDAATELLKSEAADDAPGRFFRNYYLLKNNRDLEVSQ